MDEIPHRINNLRQYGRFAGYAESMDTKILNIRPVDDKKITDHHAIIITENIPESISADE